MTDVKTPDAKPSPETKSTTPAAGKPDYRPRPAEDGGDVAAVHRELVRRYPVIRAHLAK